MTRMKVFLFIISILCLAACSKSPSKGICVALPADVQVFEMDSVDSGVLLNATGMVALPDYLIISNLHKDTLFDVFDVHGLEYRYSGLIYGGGSNDMLPFRWIRPLDSHRFYAIGLGVPLVTVVDVEGGLKIDGRKQLEWEKDVCQNLYPLKNGKVLIQPGKRQGGWSLYDMKSGDVSDMPDSPFQEDEPEADMIQAFQYRAVNVAVNADKERIAFFYSKFPFVRFFDFDGNLLVEYSVGEEISDPQKFFHREGMYYWGCSYTADFIFVKYAPDNEASDVTCFQVWDWEGNLLSRFNVADKINLFTVSADGKRMFAAKNDNNHIFWCNIASALDCKTGKE